MDAPVANAGSAAARIRGAALGAALVLVLAGLGVALWLALKPAPIVALRIAAGPANSDSFRLLQEISEVALRQGKPVAPRIVATRDPSQSIALLNRGEVDLAVIRADTPVASGVHLVSGLFVDHFQLIVRAGSGITSYLDLPGRRVALPEAGTDAYRSFFVIVDHYDLPSEGMITESMSIERARRELINGTVDALFTVRSLRDPGLTRLMDDAVLKRLALDLVPVPQAQAIALKRPLLSSGTIPLGALSGAMPAPSHDMPSVAVARILVARDDADAAAIHALTEVMFENRLDLAIRTSLAAAVSRPDEGTGLTIPLHEGAARFFNRDAPSSLERNSNSIGLLLTIAAMVGSGLLALRSWFLARQKNKVDLFNHRLTELNTRALAATEHGELADIRGELAQMLSDVVAALDTDEVTDEGFHSFSRILDSVSGTVRDREAMLRGR